ncbi:MAG: hypothetical protein LBN25_00830 [Christensenellaceae bacterium]|nr:hypothetical protein [Christensenellaceae bacterium]
MQRISIPEYAELSDKQKALYDGQIAQHGRITNMKKTLLHSPLSFEVLMEWYPLRAEIAKFLGDFGTYIFSYAVSSSNDCMICSTFFRKILKDNGKDPDNLTLSAPEQLLWDFGRAIVKNPHDISEDIYTKLKEAFSEEQIVALTAFASQMIATNLINTVLQVPLDEYLYAYKK